MSGVDEKHNSASLQMEAVLSHVINELPDVFFVKDKDGKFVLCNEVVANLYNTTPEDMIGKNDLAYGVNREMVTGFTKSVHDVIQSGKTEVVFEDSKDAQTGEVRHFKSVKKPIKNEQGDDLVIVIAQDITDAVQTRTKLQESENRLNTVMDVIQECVWDWHIPTGTVIHNVNWYHTLGLDPEDGRCTVEEFMEKVHPDDVEQINQEMGRLLSGEIDRYVSEHRMLKSDGSSIDVRDRGTVAERDKNGAPVRVIGSFKNITDEKKAQRDRDERNKLLETTSKLEEQKIELTRLATTDQLSGLKNRHFCEDLLTMEIERFKRTSVSTSIILIDIDHFKKVNDTYGHDVGDDAIRRVSQIFEKTSRQLDIVGRWGGEEFMVICPETNLMGALELAEKIRRKIETNKGFPVPTLTCSFGVANVTENDDMETVFKRADKALYQSKSEGRNRVSYL